MKIIAISNEHSDKDAIALVTEPPLTPQIFEEVVRRIRTPEYLALSIKMVAGCLVIDPPAYTPELRTGLEQLLSEAEDIVSGGAAKRQQELELSEKELTLESAAAGFGLPIV